MYMDQAIMTLLNDSKATVTVAEDSMANMNETKEFNAVNTFDLAYVISNPNVCYSVYSTFVNSFINAYQTYTLGTRGIYKVDNETENNDLYNIIIDVEYEDNRENQQEVIR